MTTTPKLKPCPFCGWPASRSLRTIMCVRCGAMITRNAETLAELDARWNRRLGQKERKK
jgi:hypothetical protein